MFTLNALSGSARAASAFGAAALAIALVLLAFAREPWQIYAAYFPSHSAGSGGACHHPGADQPSGSRANAAAISLALNGAASAASGGAAPRAADRRNRLQARDADRRHRDGGVPRSGGPPGCRNARRAPAHAARAAWTRRDALRSLPFWTVSGSFSLVVLAQVGFIVHQIAFTGHLSGGRRRRCRFR